MGHHFWLQREEQSEYKHSVKIIFFLMFLFSIKSIHSTELLSYTEMKIFTKKTKTQLQYLCACNSCKTFQNNPSAMHWTKPSSLCFCESSFRVVATFTRATCALFVIQCDIILIVVKLPPGQDLTKGVLIFCLYPSICVTSIYFITSPPKKTPQFNSDQPHEAWRGTKPF